MGAAIWKMAIPVGVAAFWCALSAAISALVVWLLSRALHVEVSYASWLFLTAINVVVSALSVLFSKIVAARHSDSSHANGYPAGKIETVALGFGVLGPLSTLSFVLISQQKPEAVSDSIVGAVLYERFQAEAVPWYVGAVVVVLLLSVAVSAVAALSVRRADHLAKDNATNFAFVAAVTLLAINSLFLQPWLPDSIKIEAGGTSVVELLGATAIAGLSVGLPFIYIPLAIQAAVAGALAALSGARATVKVVAVGVLSLIFGVLLVALACGVIFALFALIKFGFGALSFALNQIIAALDVVVFTVFVLALMIGTAIMAGFALSAFFRWVVRNHRKAAGGLAVTVLVVGIAMAISSTAGRRSTTDNRQRVPTSTTTSATPTTPLPPLFERAQLSCVAWNPFWSLFSTDRLSVDAANCSIERADEAKFIVVVGSASRGPEAAKEEQRAFERGLSLAKNIRTSAQVYVLNLGVVPVMEGQGEREAPFVAPIISRREMKPEEFEQALREYIAADASLPAHTQCTVYRFAPARNAANFNC